MKTFLQCAEEFIKQVERSKATRKQQGEILSRLQLLHDEPIDKLTCARVFAVLRTIEQAGHLQTARRALQLTGRAIQWGIVTGQRTAPNFVDDLRGMLKSTKSRKRPALTDPKAVGGALQALSSYRGRPSAQAVLRLLPHVFVRPVELREATWREINFDKALWVIPAERMKMRREHAVPLSRQAISILRELEAACEYFGEWVFPGLHAGPLGINTLSYLHRVCGIDPKVHVPHGWRSTASTILNERGWDSALIELQLAHAKKDRIAGIYDRSQRLPERAVMMQTWSDMLDAMRDGA